MITMACNKNEWHPVHWMTTTNKVVEMAHTFLHG